MFKNSSKIMFMFILMLGTLLTVSSNSWLGAWMGLEINLLSFIPLMNENNNLMSTEASLKYFLIQALASTVLLFAVIISMLNFNITFQMSTDYPHMIILSSLLLKSGAAPFHFWFPEVMKYLSWMNALILMTWQKIAPMMLISYLMFKELFYISILLSIIIGSLGGLNQTSLQKIMAYSSINHLGWMLASMMTNESLWFTYFLMYTLLSFNLVYFFDMFKLFHLNQLFNVFFSSKTLKFSLFLNLLSLGGLPPFLGFLPKWIVIQSLTFNNQLFLMTMMITMTLITLFFYIRLCYSAFMLNYYETNWLYQHHYNNTFFYFYLILSFISTFGLFLINLTFFTF